MSKSFLEPDHLQRNFTIFSIALLIAISGTIFYFMSNRGCGDYATNLKNCTPYECTQRVTGFKSENYAGHTAFIISRKILGYETDKFYSTTTCNVIEIDNVRKNQQFICKYSPATLEIAASRAAILFGNEMPPASENQKKLSNTELAAVRASYAVRTDKQAGECIR